MSNLTVRQGFAPTTLSEAIQFSEMLSTSTMVPKQYNGKPTDILVAMQWGAELGLAPLQALQNIAVINGKPSVYGDAAMALVQNNPVCEDIEEFMEDEGTPNPSAVCVAKRKGRKPVTAKFSVEDAKRAGLWGKQGPWTQYPKRMLQMRARGFALRDAFPDVLKGLITIEEALDFPTEATPAPVQEIAQKADLAIENMASDQVGGFPFFLPVGSIYSSHESAGQWIDAYCVMVKKITDNGRLTDFQKEEKLKALAEANMEVTSDFDSFHKIKLRGEMVKAGASVSPKSEASPSNQDLEPNENES
jgi:hypothetical protein